MKKTYVKPTAECEEFVANEFVAACWDVICNGSDGIWGFLAHEKHETVAKGLQEEPESAFSWDQNFGFWRDDSGQLHYDVEKIDRATAEHPNASV